MTAYVALIRKDRASDYGVDFPDFPGCITAGQMLDEARQMAAEALGFHIEGMAEDHATLPPPSSLDAVMAQPDNRGAIAVLVDTEARPSTMQVSLTLPVDLLDAIDTAGADRAEFLIRAAREKLSGRTAA